jgi:hypothetical protein
LLRLAEGKFVLLEGAVTKDLLEVDESVFQAEREIAVAQAIDVGRDAQGDPLAG